MANLLFANKLRYKFFLCMHDEYQYQINFVETLCEIYSISNNDEDFGRVYKGRSLKDKSILKMLIDLKHRRSK